jgi:hypothetical protein
MVKHFEFENNSTMEKTLFTSNSESDCWAFVRNHLTCGISTIRKNAMNYVVMDSLGRCYDESMDIIALKKFERIAA